MKPFTIPTALVLLLSATFPLTSRGQGFATAPTTWTVPATGHTGTGAYGFYNLSNVTGVTGRKLWSTLDLNGDARPDLVVTSLGSSTSDKGAEVLGGTASPHWDVYLSTATGFATAPTTWAVPATGHTGTGAYGFYGLSNVTGVTGRKLWNVLDVNGDARPDLVVTSLGSSTSDKGAEVLGGTASPHWDVYLNTGQGFATTATTWTVPATGHTGTGAYGFYGLSNVTGVSGRKLWNVLDVNGDARPDLVVTSLGSSTSDKGAEVLGGTASPHWDVYLNTGQGFATTATTWAVPATGHTGTGAYGFYGLNNVTGVTGRKLWNVLDVNGDARPDLVVTSLGSSTSDKGAEVLGGTASPHWDVYLNTGQGFATTATTWAVPATGHTGTGAYGFYGLNNVTSVTGRKLWNVLDVNGDARPDLVVTSLGSSTSDKGAEVLGGTASPHWDVYLSTATGFATTATTWTVPATGHTGTGAYGFYGLSNVTGVSGRKLWNVLDVNGDARPDLVVTSLGSSTSDKGAEVLGGTASPHWDVYLSSSTISATTATVGQLSCDIYPNPTTGPITVLSSPAYRGTTYRLLDGLGRVQATGTLTSDAQQLDLRALSAGVYTLQLQTATPRFLRVVKH
ncbi:T9SS type A sorting domain-containing protein [Hymenobacter sp. ASUV-10]|uniref:T9SS type A sorting domain-containing protein n=1 Tax=Hymenobacter aranciens TaxID=3063996 RepID=A0ABT9BCP0_9BACT|nr:T9SS type A sorting domain-containing protein [Hymenobacter sp. ASUV-10]MDO7876035.1 T9SS type A sorting domain-containing protein [Hymenobacter sp. ASUV-10]